MVHILTDEEEFCLQGCGSYKQYYIMRKRFEEECVFCVIDPQVNKILFENEHWRLWENAFVDGRGMKTALLIASKEHWRALQDIPRSAWSALYDALEYAEEHFDLPGGMLFMRFGDMRMNAGTVPHLHINLWVPSGEKEVRVPIFKKPEDRQRNIARASAFARRYEAGETP